ncbi:MAG: hypothetical protein ACSHX8_15475 [Opitutaceae bacterium]
MIPIILIALFVAGCGSTGPKNEQDNLALLPFFTQSTVEYELLELLEGLPHQILEKEALKKEIKDKDVIKLNGHWFYEQPLRIQSKDESELREILSDNSTYTPFSGVKRCGGFHPDYAVKLLSKAEIVSFHICFGCREIKVYRGRKELHADLCNESYDRLKELLKGYSQNRPDRSEN